MSTIAQWQSAPSQLDFPVYGSQVVPVCDENVTVEQYLEAEMQRQVQKIKVRPQMSC